MKIYQFKPTFLYIKQHTVTGKLYLGKTIQLEKEISGRYKGSGSHWLGHINKHNQKYVITLWHELFHDEFECITTALWMSHKLDIVESDSWLNLIPEDGLGGGIGSKGRIVSEKTRKKLSEKASGVNCSEETRLRMSQSKTILYNFLTPDGIILKSISMKELCLKFNLNFKSARQSFIGRNEYKKYKKLSTTI